MITSAPFDNWWHNAYGLDVTILSPPHVLLMSGSIAIDIGTLILIGGAIAEVAWLRFSEQNDAPCSTRGAHGPPRHTLSLASSCRRDRHRVLAGMAVWEGVLRPNR
jgi:hypothetical protein